MADYTQAGPPAAEGSFDKLGDVLRRANIITDAQQREIMAHAERHDVRFGEAAITLGYIDELTLQRALATQFDLRIPEEETGGEPVAYSRPHSQAAEDYRSIRNALALRWFKHPQGAQTLAVVSPQRGDGRSLMAANLAVCFAQVGFRTLLVDADMRNPIQHRLFKLDDRQGLATLLAGRVDGRVFNQMDSLPTLSVMPVGGLPPNPQELLLRPTLGRLIEEARSRFEMILFDTPAASTGSDYQIIGAEAVGALIVTRREKTRTRDAKQLVDACRGFGIRVVGSAMTSAR
jgi:chain length determinant protein tyrosine kinase EpsG